MSDAFEWPSQGLPEGGIVIEQLLFSSAHRIAILNARQSQSDKISRALYVGERQQSYVKIAMPRGDVVARDVLLEPDHQAALLSLWMVTEDGRAMNWFGLWRLPLPGGEPKCVVGRDELDCGESRRSWVNRLMHYDLSAMAVIATVAVVEPSREVAHYIARVELQGSTKVELLAPFPVGRW